jgi:hypothetical protein
VKPLLQVATVAVDEAGFAKAVVVAAIDLRHHLVGSNHLARMESWATLSHQDFDVMAIHLWHLPAGRAFAEVTKHLETVAEDIETAIRMGDRH